MSPSPSHRRVRRARELLRPAFLALVAERATTASRSRADLITRFLRESVDELVRRLATPGLERFLAS
jgi:hypothetical protein